MNRNNRLYMVAILIIVTVSSFIVPTTSLDASYFVSGHKSSDSIYGEAKPHSLDLGLSWSVQEVELTQTWSTTFIGPRFWFAIVIPFVENQYEERLGCSYSTWIYSTGLGQISKDSHSACGWLSVHG